MDILSRLNPIQQEIVKDTEGQVLTLAGAGAGKTRVLTHRIAYLIQCGLRPWQILSVTFTNKAAREMKDRVIQLVGAGGDDLWIGTFHSTCNRILRRFSEQAGLTKNFTIIDEKDRTKLVKQCMEACGVEYEPDVIISAIGTAKNDLLSPEDLHGLADSKHERDVANVYMEYEAKKNLLGYIDFDDMIYKTVRLLQNNPDIRELYSNQFRYVMADEGQDTNAAQYKLLDLFTSHHGNLFVVADIDQSIYRWRGAKVQNMIRFQEAYPDSRIHRLEQNYRSTSTIVQAANAIIKNNEERIEKTSWTENPLGDPIVIYGADDDAREADFVSSAIRRIMEVEGRPHSDFAVLYRTGRQSRMIELSLTQAGLSYQVIGGKSFYDRKEIKDLVAYLRVIANEFDALAAERIINVPKRGIGDTTVKKIDEYAKQTGIPFSKALNYLSDIPKLSKGTVTKIEVFVEFINQLRDFASQPGTTVYMVIKEIFNRTGFMDQYDPNKEEDEGRIENIQELLRVANEWDKNNEEEKTLADFLSETTLSSDSDELEDDDKVTLMTIHASKGLEYPYVFIVGFEESIFPHSRSLGDPAELEEERRLAYVAVTRAEKKLFITFCKSRYDYNDPRPKYNRPSRFINEIPKELIKKIG